MQLIGFFFNRNILQP